jgi:Tol biopolymer transport system component
MKETRIEKVALALTAIFSLLLSGLVLVSIVWLLLLLSSPVVVRPAFAQTTAAALQLEAGIAKEEVDGDLKSAMETYQKIAAESSAPRDVRAKALLHIGGCYEKLGKQARQVYEQVVRDYADQPAASQARSRLTALKQQEHPVAPTTMTVRKIEWSALGNVGPDDTDGQRAIYGDFDGSIVFGDLAGRTKKVIYKHKDSDGDIAFRRSRDFSTVSLGFPATPNQPAKLAVIKADGSAYRELVRDDTQGTILGSNWDRNWSWDDHYLVVWSNHPKGGGHLFIVSVADGQRRELLSIETGNFNKAVFSPDGRFIAYEVAPSPDQGDTSRVFVVPSRGGQPQLVYESAPSHKYVWFESWTLRDWTADARYLIVADARAGRAALYLLPVKNGTSATAPVFIRLGECEDGFTTVAGAFVYRTMTSGNTEVYLASLDASGAVSGWRRLALRNFGMYLNPDLSFSPDGSHVAYIAKDEDPAFGRDLVLRNLSDGEERVLYRSRSADHLFCQYAIQHPKVFCTEVRETEGKEVDMTDLLAISAESGQTERLASFPWRGWIMIAKPSHDDQAIYLVKNRPKTEGGPIARWELTTRQETVVSAEPPERGFDWPSLDDRRLVRAVPQSVSVRPISGGEWKPLASLGSGPGGHVTTTPDGNWLLYHSTDSPGKHILFRIPILGGQPQSVGSFPTGSFSGSLHFSPDGRQLLAVSLDPRKYDLWVLDNFVPSAGKQ